MEFFARDHVHEINGGRPVPVFPLVAGGETLAIAGVLDKEAPPLPHIEPHRKRDR